MPSPNDAEKSASANTLSFPNYQPPTGQGIPFHGEKFAGPLNKLAMFRLKALRPKSRSRKTDKVRVNYKKKPKFY